MDYTTLAKQYGGTSIASTGKVDYSNLAKQFGGTSVSPSSEVITPSPSPKENSASGVGGFVKGLVRAPLTMLARPIQAAAELLGAKAEDVNKYDLGGLVAPVPQNFSDVGKDVGRGVQTAALGLGPVSGGALFGAGNSLEQGNDLLSTQTAFQTVLGAGAGKVLDLVGKPLLDTAGKMIGRITPKTLEDVASKGANAISDFATRHKILPDNVSEVINTGAGKAEAIANKPFELANTGVKKLGNVIKEQYPNNPTQAGFESKVNKALPVLKKDVTNLPQKYADVQTAFGDIASNKNDLGFTDKTGNPRNPKNFTETVSAQQQRLKSLYKDYTTKLSTIDEPKFTKDISTGIKGQVNSIDQQLAKENSIDGRRALTKIKAELSSLRDTSPIGIQNYIENINQRIKPLSPGGSLTTEQIKLANLGGDMRKILDDSVEKLNGKGYQDLRNVYKAHKSVQSQLLMAAKKEINNIPGFTDKLTNIGMTGEGINFLLTHDPHSLAIAGGLKLGNKLLNWYKSPERALQGIFDDVEKGYISPRPSKPQTINTIANSEPKISNISESLSQKKIKNK